MSAAPIEKPIAKFKKNGASHLSAINTHAIIEKIVALSASFIISPG